MGRYRKIDPRLWGDERFRKLSGLQPSGKALWLYLLTNPYSSNFAAAVPVGSATIGDDLDWSSKDVEKSIAELERSGMIIRDRGAKLIYIKRWVAYNAPESPNVAASWASSITSLAESALQQVMLKDARAVCERMDDGEVRRDGRGFVAAFDRAKARDIPNIKALTEPLPEALPEPLQQALPEGIPESRTETKQEQKQNKNKTETRQRADEVADVYSHYLKYHKRAAPSLLPSTKEYRAIRDRLTEGYSVDDLKLAIDGNHISPWHCGKNEDGKEWHGLGIIMRDGEHVQRFIEEMEKDTVKNDAKL